MSVDSTQLIKQTLRFLPSLSREIEATLNTDEAREFNSILSVGQSPTFQQSNGPSEYQMDFFRHVIDVRYKQFDEIDSHCNRIYEQSLIVARDEEYGDVYHREQVDSALRKSKCSIKEFLAIDLAIGASLFTKACKVLNQIQMSGELTKNSIEAFGVVHAEIEMLGDEVFSKVTNDKLEKYDLSELIGEIMCKFYGKDGFSNTVNEREQLKKTLSQYGATYKTMIIGLTKDMHYE